MDEFYPIFQNYFDNMNYEYDYDDLWMELFIDYAPDHFYDENDDEYVERDCLFTFIVKNDFSKFYFVWLDEHINCRLLRISDNGFGYTVNECIDDVKMLNTLPRDVFIYIGDLLHNAHLPM